MKHFIGKLNDFKNHNCKVVQIGDRNVLVWRNNDEIFATREECPHQGVSLKCEQLTGTMLQSEPKKLEYGMEGYVVRCPWHKWEFDVRTGEALYNTEKKRLFTYNIHVEKDSVFLEL